MYLPAKYKGEESLAPEFIRRHPFATMVGCSEAGPIINHLPLNIADNALWGHLAFANPTWKSLDGTRVTAIFHGPHAFIDHRWYAEPRQEVPTWNYAVVHVGGVLQVSHERSELIKALDRLQKAMNDLPSWAQEMPADLAGEGVLEKSIVGLKIEIEHMEVKQKMSQNKSAENRARVMQHLSESPRAGDQAVAQYMRELYEQ